MALIPVFVRQIKAQRSMQMIAPDLRKIQDKYKGKKDQASREAMTKETMALYSEHKTNPFCVVPAAAAADARSSSRCSTCSTTA